MLHYLDHLYTNPDFRRNFAVCRAAILFTKFITFVFMSSLIFSQVWAQDDLAEGWEILSPQPGQPVLGSLAVEAILIADGVESVEISFSYSDDPTGVWFLIAEIPGVPSDKKLVNWETSRLTDGNYTMRFSALLDDGKHLTAVVPGLRVRNYTLVETPTPTITATPAPDSTPTPVPTTVPTQTPIPQTPTALPANPAVLTGQDIGLHIVLGAIGAGAFFAVLGLYASTRKIFRG
jgi:hypothetical protein